MRRRLVDFTYFVGAGLGWCILRLACRLDIRGKRHVPKRGAVIFAANHASFLDPVVLAAACPNRVIFLARRDLFDLGWLGALMRWIETIPVRRGHAEPSLRQAVTKLRNGQSVVIFPEGVRNPSGGFAPVKPGVGWLAATAQIPVVPVLLSGTEQALPYKARCLRPRKITVAFGPQIHYPTGPVSEHAYQQLADHVAASWYRLLHTNHTPHGTE